MMNDQIRKIWTDALRSGKYHKAEGTLGAVIGDLIPSSVAQYVVAMAATDILCHQHNDRRYMVK